MKDRTGRKPWLRFCVLLLAALALQGIPALFLLMEGDGGVTAYAVYLYAALPLSAFLIPLWAGLGGVHPLAGCWPIGLLMLVLPVYNSPGMALLCVLLSLIGGVAGQEWIRKRNWKGSHHGGKKRN